VEWYLAHLLDVFRAVRRVLRDDGTCWVNLSGSFFTNPGGQNGGAGNTLTKQGPERVSRKVMEANRQVGRQDRTGAATAGYWLKPLDYVDVPGLFAHAMQADGWLLRADIALIKRAPLPESVQGTRWERCRVKVAASTRAGSDTYNGAAFDAPQGAVRNGGIDGTAQWADCPGCAKCLPNEGLVLRRGNGRPTRAWEHLLVFAKRPGAYWDSEAVRTPALQPIGVPQLTGQRKRGVLQDLSRSTLGTNYGPAGRNLLDWMDWPHAASKDAHYAAYPVGIPTLAVKAGTSERVCGACQAPWARVVERDGATRQGPTGSGWREPGGEHDAVSRVGEVVTRTLDWRPTCRCPAGTPWTAATVLDPFGGSGTTGVAADRLGRNAVLIDLQPDYTEMALRRATADAPLFAEVSLLPAPTLEGVAAG